MSLQVNSQITSDSNLPTAPGLFKDIVRLALQSINCSVPDEALTKAANMLWASLNPNDKLLFIDHNDHQGVESNTQIPGQDAFDNSGINVLGEPHT